MRGFASFRRGFAKRFAELSWVKADTQYTIQAPRRPSQLQALNHLQSSTFAGLDQGLVDQLHGAGIAHAGGVIALAIEPLSRGETMLELGPSGAEFRFLCKFRAPLLDFEKQSDPISPWSRGTRQLAAQSQRSRWKPLRSWRSGLRAHLRRNKANCEPLAGLPLPLLRTPRGLLEEAVSAFSVRICKGEGKGSHTSQGSHFA